MLASLHSLVSCELKVHFQNWLAAATLAWHIHCNDLIMMISLMEAFFYYKRVKPISLYYCREDVIILYQKLNSTFPSLHACLVKHGNERNQTGSLFSLMSLFYKRILYSLSMGKVLEGVWLVEGKFMGCEGQFEQPADGVQNCHVTFLPLSLSNRLLFGEKNPTINKNTA